jgi:hypothetical protein
MLKKLTNIDLENPGIPHVSFNRGIRVENIFEKSAGKVIERAPEMFINYSQAFSNRICLLNYGSFFSALLDLIPD